MLCLLLIKYSPNFTVHFLVVVPLSYVLWYIYIGVYNVNQ